MRDIWSDIPPSDDGWYWLQRLDGGDSQHCRYNGVWVDNDGDKTTDAEMLALGLRFGPRIPRSQELALLQRKAAAFDWLEQAADLVLIDDNPRMLRVTHVETGQAGDGATLLEAVEAAMKEQQQP